jgi:hypothetical protein
MCRKDFEGVDELFDGPRNLLEILVGARDAVL